ncbi:phospho-N-acetylmuramoyl-pentapeptide-transferase [Candidatus Sumerlaeota bacterium]|nr:phospho-N-acetylmuramoyl-pentapeptide-transferase [Candidatus Sumerlaeota bacterium]
MIFWLIELIRAIVPSSDTNLDRIARASGRVFGYISVRTSLALITSLLVSLLLGPYLIRTLRRKKIGAQILKIQESGAPDLYEMHGSKAGTPIMGGLLILAGVLTGTLLFCRLNNSFVWVAVLASLALGAIGFYDDYVKVSQRNPRGISARVKLIGQVCVGLAVGIFLYASDEVLRIVYFTGEKGATHICFPFFKNWYPDLGLAIIPFAILVLVSTSNAVNLTDGLDGLAIGISTIVAGAFLIAGYLVTRVDTAHYLMFPYVPGGSELTVILGALIGAGLGFLWFNAYPAEVFMGDTGSLLLGGLLGTTALLIKQEILLVIVGGIFVIEALSVVIQVASFKLRGKRVFLMSPLHFHYQKMGVPESRIIARFWIVSALLALVGLATLKLR